MVLTVLVAESISRTKMSCSCLMPAIIGFIYQVNIDKSFCFNAFALIVLNTLIKQKAKLWKRWPCHWISVACPFANTHFLTHIIGFALHCVAFYFTSLCTVGPYHIKNIHWELCKYCSALVASTKNTDRVHCPVQCKCMVSDPTVFTKKDQKLVIDGRMLLLCLLLVSTQCRLVGGYLPATQYTNF